MAASMEADVMNIKCSFSAFSQISCGLSSLFPNESGLTRISDCKKDVSRHLRKLRLFNSEKLRVVTEAKLISYRAGLFSLDNELQICPRHRCELGVGFRKLSACSNDSASHSGPRPKVFRHIGLDHSRNSLTTGRFLPVGTGVCRKCYDSLVVTDGDQQLIEKSTDQPDLLNPLDMEDRPQSGREVCNSQPSDDSEVNE